MLGAECRELRIHFRLIEREWSRDGIPEAGLRIAKGGPIYLSTAAGCRSLAYHHHSHTPSELSAPAAAPFAPRPTLSSASACSSIPSCPSHSEETQLSFWRPGAVPGVSNNLVFLFGSDPAQRQRINPGRPPRRHSSWSDTGLSSDK